MDPKMLMPLAQTQLIQQLRQAITTTALLRPTSLATDQSALHAGRALYHWRMSETWNGILLALIQMATDPGPQPQHTTLADLEDLQVDACDAHTYLELVHESPPGVFVAMAMPAHGPAPWDEHSCPEDPKSPNYEGPF